MRRPILAAALAALPALAQAYSFDITNNASQTIVAIKGGKAAQSTVTKACAARVE